MKRLLLAFLSLVLAMPALAQNVVVPGSPVITPSGGVSAGTGIAASPYARTQEALVSLGYGTAQASRVLRNAARALPPITSVASTPSCVVGTENANSTVITTATVNGGFRYDASDSRYTTPVADVQTSGVYVGAGTTYSVSGTPTYRGLHGWGRAFETFSASFDFLIRPGAQNFTVYVTDLATGIRARVQADDFTAANNNPRYVRCDATGRGWRRYEIVAGTVASITAINVPTTDTIRPAQFADEARIGYIGDSYIAGALSDTGTINYARMTTTDYMFARFGVVRGWPFGVGGTGVLATNSGNSANFQQRRDNGDFKISRIGRLDLLIAPPSINDSSSSSGGTTSDAVFQAAYQTYISSLMIDQPTAIIVGFGPQFAVSTQPGQSRYDAAKAGFLAAAGNDPRMIWIDNSPAGEAWMTTANIGTIIGPDNIHPNRLGVEYLGNTIASSVLQAISARFGPVSFVLPKDLPLVPAAVNDNQPLRRAA